MNQILRTAISLFTRELILAGYGLPPDKDRITNYGKEEITFRTNLRNISTFLTSDASTGQNILSVSSGSGKSFDNGNQIILCADRYLNQCEEHTLSKDGTNSSITLTSPLGTAYQAGSRIDLINTVSYRYSRSKREMQRKIDRGIWEAAAENVADDGLVISCFDRNNNSAANPSEIHRIDITLTVETYRKASATSTITLRNSV